MRLDSKPPSRPRSRRRILSAAVMAAAVAVVGVAAFTSGAARAVVQAAPKNTGEPRIIGSATVGSTLQGTNGGWSGSPTNYAFQWVRCPSSGGKSDGSDCAVISGATTSAYIVGGADAGSRLRVRVTASNSDGSATAASNPTGVITNAAGGAPKSTSDPTISGNLVVGETLHANAGTWTGTQPITFSFRWLRCDSNGNNCVTQPGQTDDSYVLRDADAGRTLRIRVAAENSDGSRSKVSSPTGVVQKGSNLPSGAIKLPNGEVSIPASSVPSSERLVVDRVDFSPTLVRSRVDPISIRVKVKDTRGYVVRDVLVFLRSTPLVTSTPAEQRTGTDGTITYTVQPEADFPLRNGYNVQFFVKGHRQGDKPLAGIAGYRLVQVPTASS